MDVYVKFKDGSETIVKEADDCSVRNDGTYAVITKGTRREFFNFKEVVSIGEASFFGVCGEECKK